MFEDFLPGSKESSGDDDLELLIALERVSAELRDTLSPDQRAVRYTADEAAAALRQLLERETGASPGVGPEGNSAWLSAAQIAFRQLEKSPDVGPIARRVRDTSGRELQMGVEVADASVVVLGLLITWMQTKVDLHIRRRNGKVEFDFRIGKGATQGTSLAPVVDAIRETLSPKSQ